MKIKNLILTSVDVYVGYTRWINGKGVQREMNFNWFCPKCNEYNVDEDRSDVVKCENCYKKFKANYK